MLDRPGRPIRPARRGGHYRPRRSVAAIEPYDCGPPADPGDTDPPPAQLCAVAIVTVAEGPEAGDNVPIDIPPDVYSAGLEPGDRVVLNRAPDGTTDGSQQSTFNDSARGFPIALPALAFAIAVVAVARWRGLGSDFFILLEFMLAGLLAGTSPVLIGPVGSSAIIIAVLYLPTDFRLVRPPR